MAGKVSKFGSGSKLLALAIAAALIAACGKTDDQAAKTVAQPAKTDAAKAADTTAPAAAPSDQAAAPAPLKSLSVSELLKRAGSALADSRFVAPPGNNAAEFYLAVLDKDSNNNAARDGLREMFPMATGAIEQQINAGQLDEGKRAIELMGKADPNNYALTILRGKLDLKRKQVDTDKEKQQAQEKALACAEPRRQTRRPLLRRRHRPRRRHDDHRCASIRAAAGPAAAAPRLRRQSLPPLPRRHPPLRRRAVPRRAPRSSSIASIRCIRPMPPAIARRAGSKSLSPSRPTARWKKMRRSSPRRRRASSTPRRCVRCRAGYSSRVSKTASLPNRRSARASNSSSDDRSMK